MLHGVTGPYGDRTEQHNRLAGQSAAGAVTTCYVMLHDVTSPDGNLVQLVSLHRELLQCVTCCYIVLLVQM